MYGKRLMYTSSLKVFNEFSKAHIVYSMLFINTLGIKLFSRVNQIVDRQTNIPYSSGVCYSVLRTIFARLSYMPPANQPPFSHYTSKH